jgi:cell division protein FtsB
MTDDPRPDGDPELPNPTYARYLEWQIAAELRRAARFGGRDRRNRGAMLRLSIVAAVLATTSLALGACGVLAVQDRERQATAKVLCEQYQARFDVARARTEAAFAELAPLQRRAEQGLAPTSELDEKEDLHLVLALEASLLGLDAIEVGYTGREPDRRLSAALVADRDLVRERLELERSTLGFRVGVATRRLRSLELLHQTGRLPAQELANAESAAAERQDALDQTLHRLALRVRFLAGTLDAVAVERAALVDDANRRIGRARAALLLARDTLQRTEQLATTGRAPQSDLERARHDLAEREAALRLAEAESGALHPVEGGDR